METAITALRVFKIWEFKSYYVVWKLQHKKGWVITINRLNRTM